jgi:sec-independent protein translocase protein TatC
VAFGVCLYFVNPILAFLVQLLRNAAGPAGSKLIYTKLYEAFLSI